MIGRKAVAAGLIAWISCDAALAQTMRKGRLVECVVKETAVTRDDGSLGETDETRVFSKIREAFLFDEANSTLRWITLDRSWQSDTAWQYDTVQSGSDQNSLVALRYYEGISSVVVDVLRVKTWVDGWPFLLVEQETVYSGNCR
jgi:hypothetical protein